MLQYSMTSSSHTAIDGIFIASFTGISHISTQIRSKFRSCHERAFRCKYSRYQTQNISSQFIPSLSVRIQAPRVQINGIFIELSRNCPIKSQSGGKISSAALSALLYYLSLEIIILIRIFCDLYLQRPFLGIRHNL